MKNDYLLRHDDFAKPREYDYKLDGIFYRDKDAKGDVFDTNGLNACGVNYLKPREIDGVFKLIEEDEKYFRLTNIDPKTDLVEFRNIVKKLLPCEHPESAFFKEVRGLILPSEMRLSSKFAALFLNSLCRQYLPRPKNCQTLASAINTSIICLTRLRN